MNDEGRNFFHNSSLIILLLFFIASNVPQAQAQNEAITWYSMQEAQKLAKKNDKKVLAYAEAEWCVYCKKMDKEVFTQKAVIDSLNAYYYPVKIDVDSEEKIIFNEEEMTEQQFAQSYQVRATPTTFFVDKSGKILGEQPGFFPAGAYSKLLAFVGSGAFQKMNFKLYIQQSRKASN